MHDLLGLFIRLGKMVIKMTIEKYKTAATGIHILTCLFLKAADKKSCRMALMGSNTETTERIFCFRRKLHL